MRAWIMVLATLIASMTYQAGLNPPGGFWQDDMEPILVPASYNGTSVGNTTSIVPMTTITGSNTTASMKNVTGHQAGDLILSDKQSTRYSVFFYANRIAFSHSLSIIVYLLIDMTTIRKRPVFILQVIVIVDVLLVLLAYSAGSSRGIGRSFVALQYFGVFIPSTLYEWWKSRCFMLGSAIVELSNRRHPDGSTSLDVLLRQIHEPPASTASPAVPAQNQEGASYSCQVHELTFPGAVPPAIKSDQEDTTEAAKRCSNPRSKKDTDYVKEMRGWIMVLATLFASMTYQAGLNPPGGFWQDDSGKFLAPASSGNGSDSTSNSISNSTVSYNVTGHRAGDPVLFDELSHRYGVFFYANTIAFSHSLSIILYLLVDMNFLKKQRMIILQTVVIIDVFLIMLAYSAGSSRNDWMQFAAIQYFPVFLPYGCYQWWKGRTRRGCSSGRVEGNAESRTTEGQTAI